MNPSFSRNKNVVPYHPLVYFLVFLIVNSFLSYFELTPAFKFWFLLIGIVLPISLALWNHRPSSDIQQFLYRSDFLPIVPLWIWATIALVAIMIRFYKLTTLSLWPHFDEAYINYYGFQLSRHWDDRLLYGSGQSTPLFMWLLAGFYKLIPPSLFSLWLFPALISMLTIPMAYVACRRFFSKSFSFLFLCLIALSFWGFYVGRFSFQYVLVLFWEFLVFYLWGGFKDKFPSKNHRELLLLAITMGLGFYVHLPAWSVFFLLWSSVIFIASTRKDHPFKIWSFLILYGGTIALVVSPLLWTAYRQGYGNYIRDLWAFSSRTPVPQQSNLIVNYFSCLFWGPNEFNAYGPFWGGFLNPILDSLFLLGILEILGNFKDWVYRCFSLFFYRY